MDLKQKSKELGFISRINLVHENLKSPDMGELELLLYSLWMSELQKWLREVHSLHISITQHNRINYIVAVHELNNESEFEKHNIDSYEKALEFGLQEALKLIKNEKD
jgi:hypothetical protein